MSYMPFKESLMRSVSMQTLVRMREEGYSNKQIADLLGTTYATIYKYLGPQRKNKKKENVSKT